MLYSIIESPVGDLLLAGPAPGVLARLGWAGGASGSAADPPGGWVRDMGAFSTASTQLAEYFAGERRTFDLPLELHGSKWELRVWTALQAIPYGETRSYGEIATAIGASSTRAARAVGLANGRNPIAIVIPCHRVIGADGSLVGFGGGLPRKRTLLDLESGRLALAV